MKNNRNRKYSFWVKLASWAMALLLTVSLVFLTSCESSSVRSAFSTAKGYVQGRGFLLSTILSNDIVFYGQVLDLEGNPVPNAEVEYSSLNSANFGDVWVGGIPSKTMQADENGRFEIHETGGSLFVACEHQDYYSTYDHAEESRRKFGYGFQVGDDPACDPKNPAIFRLHKKGVREPLYYSCSQVISKGQQWIQIPEEPYVINLANGEAQESPTSIYISYKSDRLEDERRGYAWGYTLCIPGGGFIEKSDRRDFLAPEEGYEEEIRIECLRESEDWNIWKRSFYFVRFPNGLYGTFEIYAQSSGRIIFQALINPNPDSRNLEYEYEKQINKNQRNDCYWQF